MIFAILKPRSTGTHKMKQAYLLLLQSGTNPTLLPHVLPILPILRKTLNLAKTGAGCLAA